MHESLCNFFVLHDIVVIRAMYCIAEMRMDRTGSGLKQFWPDQDWIRLQFFPKLADRTGSD